MVDFKIEVSQSEDGEKAASSKMDVNELISKVRDFVEGIKETSVGGQRMAVGVDNFNFSIGKSDGKYNLKLNVACSFSPKDLV